MVQWIQYQNALKKNASSQLLAPSQRKCYERILYHTRYANRINLFGESGVGKTFLAWVLCKEIKAQYLPSPYENFYNTQLLIIDDAPHDRETCRQLYDKALNFSRSVILITREPIDDHITRVHLSLSNEDFITVNRVIYEVCDIAVPVIDAKRGMLWNYFQLARR